MSSATKGLPRRHRLTVDDYYRMTEAGILARDARVELIEGEIIDMPAKGTRHAGAVRFLVHVLRRVPSELAILQIQDPIGLDEHSLPEPDVALLRPRADLYRSAHPRASDVLLLIEVADTSLDYDQNDKAPLYARHAIPECWIVDVDGRKLRRYREPRGGEYRLIDTPAIRQPLAVSAIPGLTLDLDGMFAD